MTIPDWWQAILLVLAAYRLTRLGGWDAFPLAAKLRARLIGQDWTTEDDGSDLPSLFDDEIAVVPIATEPLVTLPGKQPSSPIQFVRPSYRRPTLAHLVHCPFCLGWWVTLACWGSFQVWPHGALVALTPFALAGAVGLIGKDLD